MPNIDILHRGFSPVIVESEKGKQALAVNTGFNRKHLIV
ncbi:hypothetical protein SAMN05444280_14812 [Tangfeifania diversioriginum]|uniref:Uncharacterized protein n=1 Tax=Tangfeifania diversioriginum TaxID=1168035 RepID=A0A1M6NXQ1_9BACT|nr:hypothetical protein SAMN05444280_14812 [Tangfeifania diversioriginum]